MPGVSWRRPPATPGQSLLYCPARLRDLPYAQDRTPRFTQPVLRSYDPDRQGGRKAPELGPRFPGEQPANGGFQGGAVEKLLVEAAPPGDAPGLVQQKSRARPRLV